MRRRGYFSGVLLGFFLVLGGVVCVCARSGSALAGDDDQQSWYTRFGRSLLTGSNAAFLDLSETPSPIAGLSVSGFLNNSTGMWANSSALRNFGRSSGAHHG